MIVTSFEKFKSSTVKRGKPWTQIADILNSIENPAFRVTQRSIRERFSLREKAFVRKIKDEEKACGISPDELTENRKV